MYDKIVLPIDMNESASWEKALPQALGLCQAFDAALYIVTVLPEYRMPLVASYFPSDFKLKAHRALSKAQQEFVEEHVPESMNVQCIVADGTPYEGILKTAKTLAADLVVMSSHDRRRFVDYLLGPNAEHVVRHASIPVLVVR